MQTWHISGISLSVALFLIVIFSASTVGGFFMLLTLPLLVWWGYTLHERKIFKDKETEEKILARYNIKEAGSKAKVA